MSDKPKPLQLLQTKLEAISNSLGMIQYALVALKNDNIAYGSIARAMGNVGEALCEIKKEQEKDQ